MDLLITSASQAPDPELRALRMWLADGTGMRGRVGFRVQPPPGQPAGAAGSTVVALTLTADPGNDVTALVREITSWLRLRLNKLHRDTDANIDVASSIGAAITLSARLAGAWTPAELDAQVDCLARMLEGRVTSPPPATAAPAPDVVSDLYGADREWP